MNHSNKTEQQIFTLIAEVGRSKDDGLPAECSGAALMCYSCGIDEAEAVRETINILTKGVDSKERGLIKQELGSGNYLRTSFAYTTKNFKIGKFNLAGSFKQSDGIVEQTGSQGFFYYLKWQKQLNNHLFSLSAFGAPQQHDQRKYQTGMAVYDKEFAHALGVDTGSVEGGYGLNYNPNWGEYNDYQVIYNNGIPTDTIWGDNNTVNRFKNYYHKPNFNFQHLWKINNKYIIHF